MALNLGELVAGLRADESDFVRGMNEAELAMRGLTRDANGQLRDLRGQFVTDSEVMGQSLAYRIGAGARRAAAEVAKVGPAIAGIGVGVPVVAATATAFLGLAAGAVSAGLAVQAFKAAAQPQLEAVTEVTKLAEEAQEAAASGAEDAAEKQKAYADALAELPPATQAYAKELQGLKKDHQDWSDSLSSTTMPVFTKGVRILRDLLPTLTPFVQAAAKAFSGFLDSVAKGVKSARFKEWAADMANAAGPALTNFLQVIKNFAIGFGGLLQAFTSSSQGATGGLVAMSEAFAKWGASLKDSAGFAQFLEMAREGGTTLGQLALAVGNLLVALGPLIGVTTQVALALARIINALPPEVLSALAVTIASVALGMKAYAAGAAVAAAANRLMASSTYVAIAGWTRMMAVGLMAYARIAGAAVASAARTAAAWAGAALRSMATFAAQMIRTAAAAVAQFAVMAARAVAWAAVMAAQWLIAMGPIGWVIAAVLALTALIVANWDTVQRATSAAWDWVWQKIQTSVTYIMAAINWLGQIPGRMAAWFGQAKDWVVAKLSEMVTWVAGVPGRVSAALAGLLGALRDRAASAGTAMVAALRQRLSDAIAWVRGLPGRARSALGNLGGVLVAAGRSLIQGFVNGIKSMAGSVRNAASSVVSAARNFFPFSPAKEGPFSGRGYTTYSGQALVGDFARAIAGGAPGVRAALDGLTGMAASQLAGLPAADASMSALVSAPALPQAAMAGAAGVPGGALPGPGRLVRVDLGGELGDAVVRILRQKIGAGAGGDVQLYLGRE